MPNPFYTNSPISNNSQFVHSLSKTFLFQAIQFIQTLLIQLIHFSISIDFVYTLVMSKQFYIKQFSLAKVHSLNVSTQFNYQKHFYIKLFSLVKQFKFKQFSLALV